MTDSTGGPSLPQERRVVTAIPGPQSAELFARRSDACARGLGTTLPVFIEKAGGGVLVDVDGNSLIDLGAGIAVVNVGNAADAVVRNVQAQVAAFTHTCFMVTPYEGYVEVCEALNRLTPGDHAKKSALFNSGAEAVENAVKIARSYTGRDAVVVFEHGYHGRTNLTMAMTAKNMPYKDSFGPFAGEVYRMPLAYPFRWPTGAGQLRPRGARPGHLQDRQGGRRQQRRRDRHRADRGRGRLHRARRRASCPASPTTRGPTASCSSPTRSRPASRAPARMFACEHEGVVPDLITHRQGHRRRPAARGVSPVAPRSWTRRTSAASAAPTAATRSPAPRRSGAIETIETQDLVGAAARIGEIMLPALRDLQARYPVIGDVRGRGAMIAVELVKPGTHRARRRRCLRGRRVLPPARACWC